MKRRWFAAPAITMSLLGAFLFACGDLHASDAKKPAEAKDRTDLAFRRKVVCTSDRVVLGNSTLYELDKASGRVLGKLVLDSPIGSDPLVIAGTAYFVTTNGNARAVRNGKELWKTKLPDTSTFSTDHAVKVVASADYLCIAGPDFTTCIQLSTGKLLWKQDTAGAMQVSGGSIYATDKSHKVCAVDLSTGKTIWKESGEFSGPDLMLIKDGALYVSHGGDTFCKLNLSTGKTAWTKKDGNHEIIWEPIISLPGGQVGGIDRNCGLVVFDCNTGNNFKYVPADRPPISTDSRASVYSKVDAFLLDKDVFYAGGNAGGSGIGGYMSAFEPRTKKQKWLTAINEKNIHVAIPSPCATPVLYNNQLIFPLEIGIVYSLNSDTGKLSWKTETGRHWQGWGGDRRPAIFLSKDTVCVYDTNGVTALNAAIGKKLWTIDAKETFTRKPEQDGNRLYIETFEGIAYAFDLGTGKVDWSFSADGVAKKPEVVAVREGGAGTSSFSSAAWINAKKDQNWTRQKLMELFCKQYRSQLDGKKLKRTQVLALLGQPEMSYEYPKWDETPKESTITDNYRLSEKSGIFELEYDKEGFVSAYHQSDQPCSFTDYLGTSAAQPTATVDKARSASSLKTVTQVEQLLGRPGKSVVNEPPGFPTPLRFSSYYWNLSKDGRQILWVRTSGNHDQDLAKRSIDVVCIISLSPDCPVK